MTAKEHRPEPERASARGWFDWLSPRVARTFAVTVEAERVQEPTGEPVMIGELTAS